MMYVRIENGVVVNRVTFDGVMPEAWPADGETWVADAAAQIGWGHDGEGFTPPQAAPAPEGPVLVPYGVFRARWEPAELQALHEARKADWRVEDYVTLAAAEGAVNLSGATALLAKALFIALGVLSEARAGAIFAAT